MVSLSLSDIVVGCNSLMYVINKIFNPTYMLGVGHPSDRLRSRCMFIFVKALNNIGLNITLLNLMAMSLDHYIAITRPLHYPKLLCQEKARMMIVFLWLTAIICGSSDLFSAIPLYHTMKSEYNFCEIVWRSGYQEEYTVFVLAGICFIMMMYLCILYKEDRHWVSVLGNRKYGVIKEHYAVPCLSSAPLLSAGYLVCSTSSPWSYGWK